MKIKWIFSFKIMASQILFTIPLFLLMLMAMLSKNPIDFENFENKDLVLLWTAWLSLPILIIFVTSLVNKIFNSERYAISKICFQTITGFILGCASAAISFAIFSSSVGIFLFILFPVFLGSLNISFRRKTTITLSF